MQFFQQNKKVVLFVGILAFIVAVYFIFFTGNDNELGDTAAIVSRDGLVSELSVSPSDLSVGRDLLVMLIELRSLSLDSPFFTNSAFTNLEDFTVPIEAQPLCKSLGRHNPFSSSFTAVSQSLASTSAKEIVSGSRGIIVKSSAFKDPWVAFDKVLSSEKNHDINGINSASFKAFDCGTATVGACSSIMDFLYRAQSVLIKSDFVNKWEDGKQIIFSSKPMKTDTATSKGYKVSFIYFVKEATSGTVRLLAVKPNVRFSYDTVNTDLTTSQIEKELQNMMFDSDLDGLTDLEENCEGAKQIEKTCSTTDKDKRDSNGNGWWDGVEILLN